MSSVNSLASKIIVVTGANKGIGKAIVKQLVLQAPQPWKELDSVTIYLTSRNQALGLKALEDLEKELEEKKPRGFCLRHHSLDIDSTESISALSEFIKKEHNGLDILVNNAAIAFKGSAFDSEIVRKSLDTNYYGTLNMMKYFLPLMREDGRIINVSSMVGSLKNVNKTLQDKFNNPKLTISQLNELMEEYASSIDDNSFSDKGWPKSAYGVSKIGVTGLTKIYAHQQQQEDEKNEPVLIRACHPGYVNTDMTSGKGHLTVDEGAETPVFLAYAPKETILNASTRDEFSRGLGVYWSNKAVENW